jgi:hypothetical protein
MFCIEHFLLILLFSLPSMAKRRVYKTTSIARAKAAASKYRSAKTKSRSLQSLAMAKRNLRVSKWVRTVPAVGVCTFCNRQFKVPLTAMKRVADAQENLRVQFTEHKCKDDDGT